MFFDEKTFPQLGSREASRIAAWPDLPCAASILGMASARKASAKRFARLPANGIRTPAVAWHVAIMHPRCPFLTASFKSRMGFHRSQQPLIHLRLGGGLEPL